MDDIRIIHEKTGAVKFVAPHIANNAKLLKSYGYVKQDLPKKEEEKFDLTPNVTQALKEFQEKNLYNFDLSQMSEVEIRVKYEEIFGKKPGNKKLGTIIKEIQESKAIQN